MIPNMLYRYQSWNSPHGQRMIVEDELFLASAGSFNDPLEARVPLRYDLGTDAQVREVFLRHAPEQYPDMTLEQIQILAQQYLEKGLFKNPNHLEWFKDFQYIKNIRDFGICPLSATNSSILMWAHYADAHKGYCVGFDVQALQEFKESYPAGIDVLFDIYPVEYIDEFPIINPFDMSVEDLIIRPLTIKSIQWGYEREYRLISIAGANLPLRLNPNIISRVFLGCNMPEPQREEIIECLKNKSYKIELWEAKISEEFFGVYFTNINY